MSESTRDPYHVAGHIRRDLWRIRDHYEAALTPAKGVDESGLTSHGQAGEPVPTTALDARHEARRDLAYWARFILDEVNGGTITTTPVEAASIHALVEFIDRWALALAEQMPDDADNLRTEASKHARRLEALAQGRRAKRIQVGRCPEQHLVTGDDGLETLTPCTGDLWAVLRHDDDGLLPSDVTCDNDREHTWTPWQWRDLGRRIGTSVA